ncbi:MAG: helix-turn-helix transcriptional regulator [Candidatus Dormibacteraeota bacterium]|nr:helix-turn-helix transcriptional regulator [Candidatus Dormibacteraeota bacterium]
MEILILGHLVSGPAHGYEIKQRVGRSIGNQQMLNNNVLYPALRRFEEMGAVTSELVPQRGSPPRRVYHLTESGLDVLRAMLEDFPPEGSQDLTAEFNVRVGYFHLLDPEARLRILRIRAEAVRRLIDYLRESVGGPPDEFSYAPRLVAFLVEQAEVELRFIEQLSDEERKRPA